MLNYHFLRIQCLKIGIWVNNGVKIIIFPKNDNFCSKFFPIAEFLSYICHGGKIEHINVLKSSLNMSLSIISPFYRPFKAKPSSDNSRKRP